MENIKRRVSDFSHIFEFLEECTPKDAPLTRVRRAIEPNLPVFAIRDSVELQLVISLMASSPTTLSCSRVACLLSGVARVLRNLTGQSKEPRCSTQNEELRCAISLFSFLDGSVVAVHAQLKTDTLHTVHSSHPAVRLQN